MINKTNKTYMTNMTYRTYKTYLSYWTYFVLFVLFFPFFATPVKPLSAALISRPPSNLGLVGYWPMDEGSGTKVRDASGNGNTGTITGATWTNGKYGKGMNFANTGYINVGNPASFRVPDKTISFWAKPTANETYDMIFSNQSGNYYVTFSANKNLFVSYVDARPVQRAFILGTNVVSVNSWAHYSVTFQVSGSNVIITGYKNGNFINSVTHTDGYSAGYGSNFLIGAFSTSSGAFQGDLDDVRIYNRTLSANEISAMYKSGQVTKKQASNQGLVGYWSFNEGQGSKAGDSSGNGNTGTITGATWIDGKRGKALSFNGSSYVNSLSNLSIYQNSFSASVWFKTSSSADQKIVSNNASFHQIQTLGGVMRTCVNGCTAGTTYVNDGKWHFAVVVGDESGIRLYLDGNSSPEISQSTSSNLMSGILSIGKVGNGGTSYYFNGSIDDVRIYNRALSVSEIQNLYGVGQVTYQNPSNLGLVGYWPMEEGVGTKVGDASGSGNSGTLNCVGTDCVLPEWDFGKKNKSLRFIGSSSTGSYIQTQYPVIKNINDNVSIALDLKINPLSKSVQVLYIGSGSGRLWLHIASNGKITINSYFGTGKDFYLTGNKNVADGKWNKIILVFDKSGNQTIYVNGEIDAFMDISAAYLDTWANQPLIIGRSLNTTHWDHLNGFVDEARIYNRALSSTEVLQLYNSK